MKTLLEIKTFENEEIVILDFEEEGFALGVTSKYEPIGIHVSVDLTKESAFEIARTLINAFDLPFKKKDD